MIIYPHRNPIILTRNIFVEYGGQAGQFSDQILNSSFWMAEMQVTSYLGTPLMPSIVTGTYPFMTTTNRIATDYGYVQQMLAVNTLSKQAGCSTCSLQTNDGCAYIYSDTYGYVDVRQLASSCGCGWWYSTPYYNRPYQFQLSYEAGLPTGTATMPGILEALAIVAQIDLNEKMPGAVGINEGVGDVGIQKFSSMDDYHEERAKSALIRTNLGSSAKAMYAKRILDATIPRARKALLI